MKNKKLIMPAIIILGLLAVSAVCAADNVTDDVAGNAADEVAGMDDIQAIEQSDDREMTGATDETYPLNANSTPFAGTFSQLTDEIGSGGNITLAKAIYEYDEGDTIEITTSGIIDGRGFTIIDMKNADVQVFKVSTENVTFKGITFRNIHFDDYGGGIYFNAAHGSVESCRFEDNSAPLGSSIFFNDDYGTVVDCYFENNRASNFGGAIYDNGQYLSLINCVFIANTAFNEGGAVYISGRYSTIRNCSFKDSSARYGGAVYLGYGSSITDCNFTNNKASGRGGAVNVFVLDCEVDNCIFTDNGAYSEGGALYFGGQGIVRNSAFIGNDAFEGGAILFNRESNVTCCNFNDNSADYGGAISFDFRSGSVSYCNFRGNHAETEAGAMFYGSAVNSNFTANSASEGGAIYCGSADDCCFTGNSADYGGALYGSKHVNCIFTNNKAQHGADFYSLSNIICHNMTAFYNATEFLVITLVGSGEVPINNVSISVDFNGVNNFITDDNGQVSLPTFGLDPNTYFVGINYAGNENYAAVSAEASVTILKSPSKLTASNIGTVYNTEKFLVATLKYENGTAMKGVNVTVGFNGGVVNLTTDDNGQVKVSSAGLIPKTYKASFSFAGNDYIAGSSATATVTVNKITSKLTASSITAVYNIAKTLVATLKDASGNVIKGSITLKISNLYTKTLTTDKSGQVKFSLPANLVPKAYTATIKFAGNTYYAASSKSVKVTVKKDSTKLVASNKVFTVKAIKKVTATLKDSKNRIIKNRQVTFKVNGITYKVKTNTKGVATATVKIVKKGTFSAVIGFAGDQYYNKAATKTIKITVR